MNPKLFLFVVRVNFLNIISKYNKSQLMPLYHLFMGKSSKSQFMFNIRVLNGLSIPKPSESICNFVMDFESLFKNKSKII